MPLSAAPHKQNAGNATEQARRRRQKERGRQRRYIINSGQQQRLIGTKRRNQMREGKGGRGEKQLDRRGGCKNQNNKDSNREQGRREAPSRLLLAARCYKRCLVGAHYCAVMTNALERHGRRETPLPCSSFFFAASAVSKDDELEALPLPSVRLRRNVHKLRGF